MSSRPSGGVKPIASKPVMAMLGAPGRSKPSYRFNPYEGGGEVPEKLPEIIDASQELVRKSWRKSGVPRRRIVGNVERRHFVVVLHGRTHRRNLIALPDEVVK